MDFFPEKLENGGYRAIPPLGCMYLAGFIREKFPQIEVKIYDQNVTVLNRLLDSFPNCNADKEFENVREVIRDFKPDMVGISVLFCSLQNIAHRILQTAKSENPKCVTVVGGGYASALTEAALRDKNLDFAVIGEGEPALALLIDTLLKGSNSFESIPSLGFKKDNIPQVSKACSTNPFIPENIDEYPFPARDLLPDHRMYTRAGRMNMGNIELPGVVMNIFTSRGCPAKCFFCGVPEQWGKKIRLRSAENVLREVRMLKDQYGIDSIVFTDSNITANRQRAIDIFKGLIEMKVKWIVPEGITAWNFSEELVDVMVASGMQSIYFGIESGNQEFISKIMHKPLRIDTLWKSIENVRRYKEVYIGGFFIFGMPYETKSLMGDTQKLAQDLALDWNEFAVALPYPGTLMYTMAVKEKFLDLEYQEKLLNDFNYHFLPINTPEFDNAFAQDFSNTANLGINFLNNPNIKRKPQVALKDFKNVASKYPFHSISLYSQHLVYKELGEDFNAKSALNKAWEVLKTPDGAFYKTYYDKFGIETPEIDMNHGRSAKYYVNSSNNKF